MGALFGVGRGRGLLPLRPPSLKAHQNGTLLSRAAPKGQQLRDKTAFSACSAPVSYTHLTLPTICSV
eukprot:1298798-Alexandrium_andersonii.AAC.1